MELGTTEAQRQPALADTGRTARASSIPLTFIAPLIALLAAYALLPWAVHKTAALTGNAYDLAEWMSIHPAVRAEPLMLTTLLLRLPLVCVAWWAALYRAYVRAGYIPPVQRHIPPILRIIIVVLIAVALLPPFEFLTSARDDPNYQQQAMLAALALIGGLALLWMHHARALHEAPLRVIQAVIILIGAGVGVWGTARALGYWDNLGMALGVGAGLIVFSVVSLGAAWIAIRTSAGAQ